MRAHAVPVTSSLVPRSQPPDGEAGFDRATVPAERPDPVLAFSQRNLQLVVADLLARQKAAHDDLQQAPEQVPSALHPTTEATRACLHS